MRGVAWLLMLVGCTSSEVTGDAGDGPLDAPAARFDARLADAPAARVDAPPGNSIDASIDAPPGGSIDAGPGAVDGPVAGPVDASVFDARPVFDAPPGTACADPGGMPAPTLAAWQRVNDSRIAMGISCAALVPALATSARKHCEYWAANSGACVADPHKEVAGCTGFIAVGFSERETKAGYGGSPAFETMAFGALGASAAQLWIDSVWHRTPLLSPWVRDLGHGETTQPKSCATMDFGVGPAAATSIVATWPYDGQIDVPTSFDGSREGPEPPVPPDGWPSGYPITIYLRGTVSEHLLTVDGETAEVAHRFLTPGTPSAMGLLSHEHVLYADEPLRAATRYRVRVVADTATREWTFTTR